jgi:NADH dehydrogenase
MKSQLVTIFGGSGFLGRHTVRALARDGWRIKVATRRPNMGFFLRPLGSVGQIDFVKANVADPEQVAAAVSGAEAVIDLAGILVEKGQSFDDVHARGAENVARAAAAAGVDRLVHVSAIGADAQARSDYAASKGRGEAAVRAAFPSATILRPSIMFGPEDSFFNRFADLARYLPALPLVGGGKTLFQPVFAGDVAAAIAEALREEAAQGRIYELGGPTVYSFRQLMQFILNQTGRRRALIPIPFMLASWQAAVLQILPKPLLTPDQVRLLRHDNVTAPGMPGLSDLGIIPTSVEAVVPSYLWRYRARGEYADRSAENAGF